jgi:D-psicose/D-tagatose/L-ribulose 3-epimerase
VRFGINTFLWSSNFGSAEFHLLPEIKQHGFDGIEATLLDLKTFEAAAIRRALEEHDLACTVCSVLPPNSSLISPDAAVRAKARTYLSDAVKATAEAGSQVIAGPLYSPVGYLPGTRRTEDEWKRAVEGWQELGLTLDSYKVDVGLEPLNRFETYFLNLSADAARLCDEINHPRVGILWDTFHANIEEKHLSDSLLAAGRHLKHVHTCENDRGIPGTGHVDWTGVFRTLSKMGYDNWLTIESFGFHIDALSAAAAIWRDLAPTAEDIAWHGVEFLKQNVAQREGSLK